MHYFEKKHRGSGQTSWFVLILSEHAWEGMTLNLLIVPWEQCNDWSDEKHKPKLSSERRSLHDKESVHDTLPSVNGTVNIVEDKHDDDTSPQNNMVHHSL